jgi:RHS repeat-associated protein
MILQVAAELDGQGALRWRFVYATGKHLPDAAIDAAGVVYRLVTDQVGSLRLVVRASDGAVMQRMRHDAWGRVEEDFVAVGFVRVPFGFAGGLVDQVTGLVHFGAREYDPAVGRWVEKDPIGFEGGTTGLYEYVGGRPLDATDPGGQRFDYGHCPLGRPGAGPWHKTSGELRTECIRAIKRQVELICLPLAEEVCRLLPAGDVAPDLAAIAVCSEVLKQRTEVCKQCYGW